jgi:phospholipid/cholesterol/gamma-HCH transport system substrate-binding protein
MIEANRYKLGIFMIIGIILILGGIFVFGVSQFFVDKVSAMTIFYDSVDGLSVGSPVKFNGVPIGIVKKITINQNADIDVRMELYPSSFSHGIRTKFTENKENDASWREVADEMVKSGIRCSLQLQGITGEKFISFQYYRELKELESAEFENVKVPYDVYFIPSKNTYISSAPDNISKALKNISEVNFNKIADNFENSVTSINKLTQKLDVLLSSLQGHELNRSLVHTMNQIDVMASAVTELCQDLDNEPSSVVWGVQEKEILPEK